MTIVPGMNILDAIESRNQRPAILPLASRNALVAVILLVPVLAYLQQPNYAAIFQVPFKAPAGALLATLALVLATGLGGWRTAGHQLVAWGADPPVILPRHQAQRYLLARLFYIIVYEAYFRGFLLWLSLEFVGLPIAIAINLVLYLIAHHSCERKILLGCIPMCILLCLVNYWASSVYPAIMVHIALTMPYESLLAQKISQPVKTRIA
jgi:hypothetical protein